MSEQEISAVGIGEPDAQCPREFARQILAIGTSVAEVLALLNEVTANKRGSILGLAMAVAGGEQPKGEEACCAEPAQAPLEAAKAKAGEAVAAYATGEHGPMIGILEHAVVHSLTLAIQNTVAADQQLDIIAQAALVKAVERILSK